MILRTLKTKCLVHPNYISKTLNQGLALDQTENGIVEPKCRTCKKVRSEFVTKKLEMLQASSHPD